MSVREDYFKAQADTIRALTTGAAATDPNKIIVFQIDTKTGRFGFVETVADMDEWCRMINSDALCATLRSIKGRVFDCLYDANGLLTGDIISAVDSTGAGQFIGNIVINAHNRDGDITGLTPDDMQIILDRLAKVKVKQNGKEREIIVIVLDDLSPLEGRT